ncbi:hypothetical protein GE09DRAFT_1226681 [Coniochaeta sp. 2T2.1]|nr:hypothetical protein GE09DRAFT_1226681 [Coniochaeta sp. 2T2.1]
MAPLPIATAITAPTSAPAHPTATPTLSDNGTKNNTITPRANGDNTSPATQSSSTSTDPTSQAGIAIGATIGALFLVALVIGLWMLYRFLQRAREAKAKQRRDDRRTRREREKTDKLRRDLEKKQQAGYDTTRSSSPSHSLRADAISNYSCPTAEVDYTCETKYDVHYLAKFPFPPPAVKVPTPPRRPSSGGGSDDYPPQPPSDDVYPPKHHSGGGYYPPRAGGPRVSTDRPDFPPGPRRNSATVTCDVHPFDPEAYRDPPRRPSDDSMRAVISPRLPDYVVKVSPVILPTSNNGNGSSGSQSRGRAPGSSTYRAVVSTRRPSQGYGLGRSSRDGPEVLCLPTMLMIPQLPKAFTSASRQDCLRANSEDDDYVAKQPPTLGPDGGSGAAAVPQAQGRGALGYTGNRAVVSTRRPPPSPEEDYVGKKPTGGPDGGRGGGARLKDEETTRYRAVGYIGGPVTPVYDQDGVLEEVYVYDFPVVKA